MMKRLILFLQDITSTFWFLPGLMIFGAIVLAHILVRIDEMHVSLFDDKSYILFSGQPNAARDLLAVIAGSLVTVISIAFSITIVALQQAASQYSPRVINNFVKDRSNQFVLGSYLGTFTYALFVLRNVRGTDNEGGDFVPKLAISAALLMALTCVGLLIFFISHIATSMQVEKLVQGMRNDFFTQIDELYPEEIGYESNAHNEDFFPDDHLQNDGLELVTVQANSSGFLQAIDEKNLAEFNESHVKYVVVKPCIGDFIIEGEDIIELWADGPVDNEKHKYLRAAFIVGYSRSIHQDPLFVMRSQVDIILRALSTGVNDPTTAEDTLHQVTDGLCHLVSRKFPSCLRIFKNNPTQFIINAPGWEDYVEEAYSQVRSITQDNVRLTRALINQLRRLLLTNKIAARKKPMIAQLLTIKEQVNASSMIEMDRQQLFTLIEKSL